MGTPSLGWGSVLEGSARGELLTDPDELPRRAAERLRELPRPEVVAVQRVVDVEPDAAMQVLRRVRDAVAGLGGPVLRDRERVARVVARGDEVERPLHRQADRQHVE